MGDTVSLCPGAHGEGRTVGRIMVLNVARVSEPQFPCLGNGFWTSPHRFLRIEASLSVSL